MSFALFAVVGLVAVGSAPWRLSTPRSTAATVQRGPSGPNADKFLLRWIARTDLGLDLAAVRRIWLLAMFAGAGLTSALTGFSSLAAPMVGAAAGAVAPVGIGLARRNRAEMRVAASLPEMLELLARSLRGGADLHTALRDVSRGTNEAGRTLDLVLRRVDAGERLGDAMDRWVVDLAHTDAAVVRAVIRLGDSTGGSMAKALDRAAITLRERSALRDEIRSLTSQARASAFVVALSPLGFLVVVASTDRRSSDVLFSTTVGRMCLIGGLFLDGLGVWWMNRLTSAAAR